MAAMICAVRTSIDDVQNGAVDIHVFSPNSSGSNIVYGVKFSDKQHEGCWWRINKPKEVDLWPHEVIQKQEEKHFEEVKKVEEEKAKKGFFR